MTISEKKNASICHIIKLQNANKMCKTPEENAGIRKNAQHYSGGEGGLWDTKMRG